MIDDCPKEKVREVPASEILDKILKGEDVDYDCVIIKGDLDLSMLGLPKQHIERTDLQIGLFEDGNFEEAKNVMSNIKITNSKIDKIIRFGETIFQKAIDFMGSQLSDGANFMGSVFNGDVKFTGSQFNSYANFMGSVFNGDADFTESQMSGEANFLASMFNGNANFTKSLMSGDALFLGSVFNGDANFTESKLSDANFNNSQFSVRAIFWESQFNGNACFYDSQLSNAYFNYSLFSGNVDFWSSHFSGNVEFTRSHFSGNAVFWKSQFDGDAVFWKSQFNGRAIFEESQFNGRAIFEESQFNGDADFTKSQFSKQLSLNHTKYEQLHIRWECIKGHLEYDGATYLTLIKNFRTLEQFEDADACYYQYRNISQSRKDWYKGPNRFIDLLIYIHNEIISYLIYLMDPIVWLSNHRPFIWIHNFNWSKMEDHLSWISCGYGLKIWPMVVWITGTVLVFAYVYYSHGGIVRGTGNTSFIDSLYFSTFALAGRTPLDNIHPNPNGPWMYVALLENLLGYVFLALFVVVLGRKVVR
jgi:hypothetical protein